MLHAIETEATSLSKLWDVVELFGDAVFTKAEFAAVADGAAHKAKFGVAVVASFGRDAFARALAVAARTVDGVRRRVHCSRMMASLGRGS